MERNGCTVCLKARDDWFCRSDRRERRVAHKSVLTKSSEKPPSGDLFMLGLRQLSFEFGAQVSFNFRACTLHPEPSI